MNMQKHMSLLVLAFALCVLAGLEFGRGSIVGGYSLNRSCTGIEKQALLQFKRGLFDEFNYLSSWVGDDCCSWHGVHCENTSTSHVVELDLRNCSLRGDQILNSSLLDLKYLNYLDLSFNNFNEIKIPDFFGSFKGLTYLNLSNSNFQGLVPHHLGNLSTLHYLDLSNSYYVYGYFNSLRIDSMRWISGLSFLKHMDLSGVDISKVTTDRFPTINMLPNSILVLKLSNCQLHHNIFSPLSLVNVTSLVYLDLSHNQINQSFPLWVVNNTGLVHLNLGFNNFRSPIPKSIESLTALLELDLRYNKFWGPIPKSIESLTALLELDLGFNNFWGPIPQSFGNLKSLSTLNLYSNNFQGSIPRSLGNMTSLSRLYLSSNRLDDSIPSELGNLTELTSLYVGRNQLIGSLPESICHLSKLERLSVSENQLRGNIPKCIGELSNLIELDVYSNYWDGFVSEHHFINLTSLRALFISSKYNLVLNVSSEWVPPFQLEMIYMESLKVGPNIPRWLQTQREIDYFRMRNTSISVIPTDWFVSLVSNASTVALSNNHINGEHLSLISTPPNDLRLLDLSNNRLSGEFPAFICNLTSLQNLFLSNNNISGELPECIRNLTELSVLDVRNNSLCGDIPVVMATFGYLRTLALSDNSLTGAFPAFICNLTTLSALVLSNNNISGELPECISKLTQLQVLDLMNNRLGGHIPVSMGSLRYVTYLNLHNNKFQGKIPLSFQNLTYLVSLDLGKNNLHDILPSWTGEQLPNLKYLILRSNNFYGDIPTQLCNHSQIQVLNLARNQIKGNIPPCFGNFSAMIENNSSFSSDSIRDPSFYVGDSSRDVGGIILDTKGYELKYTSTLVFMFSIDLSSNDISGEIPEELMNLHGLTNLNLMGNRLAGRIPDKIGELDKLESLDLSSNELHGPIPQSLSNLDSLSQLNLSFNDLSGRIPTGNQLQTLDDPSIYAGNNQLCGKPVLKPCGSQAHSDSDSDSDSDEHMWFYAGIGPGVLVGFLGFCASLHFIQSWRYFYFQNVEKIFDKIVVAVALLQRKMMNM